MQFYFSITCVTELNWILTSQFDVNNFHFNLNNFHFTAKNSLSFVSSTSDSDLLRTKVMLLLPYFDYVPAWLRGGATQLLQRKGGAEELHGSRTFGPRPKVWTRDQKWKNYRAKNGTPKRLRFCTSVPPPHNCGTVPTVSWEVGRNGEKIPEGAWPSSHPSLSGIIDRFR